MHPFTITLTIQTDDAKQAARVRREISHQAQCLNDTGAFPRVHVGDLVQPPAPPKRREQVAPTQCECGSTDLRCLPYGTIPPVSLARQCAACGTYIDPVLV